MPKVSVIIPTYGVPDRLARTVDSVLQQTFTDFELIVVDDNDPETDYRKQTEAIMETFRKNDRRVIYLRHDYNKNGSAARNTGIRAARGEYISLLDSDDEYALDRLEKCYTVLKNRRTERIQGVYTGCEYRKNNKRYRIMTDVKSGNFMVDYLKLEFNLYTGSNIFITKQAADVLNGFDESFVRHQDVEFMIRFFERFDIIGIPEVLVYKNLDGKNKPSAKKTEEIKIHFFDVFKKTIDCLDQSDIHQIYGAHYRQTAEQYLLERNYRKAFCFYKKVADNHCMSAKIIMRAGVYFFRSLKGR